jgi:hypothetical protein
MWPVELATRKSFFSLLPGLLSSVMMHAYAWLPWRNSRAFCAPNGGESTCRDEAVELRTRVTMRIMRGRTAHDEISRTDDLYRSCDAGTTSVSGDVQTLETVAISVSDPTACTILVYHQCDVASRASHVRSCAVIMM